MTQKRTIVLSYNLLSLTLLNYGSIEIWFTMENYGTMEKTMLLYTKLWYNTENYGTLIYEGKKKHGGYRKIRYFDL